MSEEKTFTVELNIEDARQWCEGDDGKYIMRAVGNALEALTPPSVESKLKDLRAPWCIGESTGHVNDCESNCLTHSTSINQDKTIVNAPDAFTLLRRLYDDHANALKNAGYHDTIEALLQRSGWL